MASTYPLEVVQASRWLKANKSLKGDALKAAVDKQSWDDSVKSLVATPSVLDMMSTKLDWTQKLGDAVLAQQADVMDAVQRLRAKARGEQEAENDQGAEGFEEIRGQQAGDRDRADRSRTRSMCPTTIRRGLRRVALSGLSALLLRSRLLAGRRPSCDRPRVRRGLRARAPGPAAEQLGRRHQLGQQQHQHQPTQSSAAAKLAAQGPNTGRACATTTPTCQQIRQGNNIRGGANNRMDFRGRDGKPALRPGGLGGDRLAAAPALASVPAAATGPVAAAPAIAWRRRCRRPSRGRQRRRWRRRSPAAATRPGWRRWRQALRQRRRWRAAAALGAAATRA